MEKYSGNQKGFIYASCDAKDQKEVFEKYIEPIAESGVSFCWGDTFDKKEEDNIARSNAVLLFLTKDYVRDGRLRNTVEAAVRNDKPILTVYLEDAELDAGLSMQLESQQALFRSKYRSDEEFAEGLKKAAIFDRIEVTEQQKKRQKIRSVIAITTALIAVLVLAIVIRPLLGSNSEKATMEALGLQGLSKEELESIEELRIVGTDVKDYNVHAYYDGGDTSRIVYYDMEEDYFHGEQETAQPGNITDLSGLEQMKNLRVLELEGQQIEDIEALLGMEKLESLSLNCNPLSSLDGIEKLDNLEWLDISSTDVAEIPAGIHAGRIFAADSGLSSIPDFGGKSDVWFAANQNEFSDYTNLSTADGYDFLMIETHNGKSREILDALKGKTVRHFLVSGLQIDSLEDLSDITITEEVNIAGCSLTSLEGIENFEGITMLDLKYDTGLTDLTPVNSLKSLERITLSDELAPLAGDIDDRIEVVYRND